MYSCINFYNFICQINQHISLKIIATWCLVTLRLHRCGFKTAEQDTRSTRLIVGLPKVIPSPGYPRPCPMNCIIPRLAVLSGHAWCPFTGTSTVSCGLLLRSKYRNFSTFHLMTLDNFSKAVFFVSSSRSSLLCADLSESPSPGHVTASAPSQPLVLHYDPMTPILRTLTLDLSSVTSADLTQWSGRSQLGENWALPTWKQQMNWKKRRKTKIRPSLYFFPLRTGISHLRPVSQNNPEAFIISRNSLTT